MKVKNQEIENLINKFQEGGAVAPEGAPAPEPTPEPTPEEGGEDPMVQIAQVFMQGLQNQDCQLLAQGAQAFLELVQGAAQPQAPGQPVFKKGGKLAYWK